jgi:hypothetical protein
MKYKNQHLNNDINNKLFISSYITSSKSQVITHNLTTPMTLLCAITLGVLLQVN